MNVGGQRHLTYCLNIHPGESWKDQSRAVQGPARAVARALAGPQPFGLGLRVSAQAAEELSHPFTVAALQRFLKQENLYVFTVNGFPYGRFHGAPVKEQVYEPDWTSPLRLQYTRRLADLLVQLLPEGLAGSISTVPVGFAARLGQADARRAARQHLLDAVRYLGRLERQTGREIHLGLEPEPACLLESSADFIRFYEELLAEAGPTREAEVRHYLGVCFDTCHVALAFESLAGAWDRYRAAGVRLSKVQISAALQATPTAEAREALRAFIEPIYLHQVRARRPDGSLAAWLDLPEALAAWPREAELLRVHFHVPLYAEPGAPLASTVHTLDEAFWSRARSGACAHFEVETYTFDVLPPDLRRGVVTDSIAEELRWVRPRLAGD